MADRLAENGAIQYALANPENGSKRLALSGYIMAALNDWLKNPFPPLSRLAAPGRLRGQFFDSGVAPLAMDFANGQYASGSAGNMSMKSFDDIVTFSRTSNATVTRSDGTIGFAPMNLLTHSEQFDNAAWSKVNATVTQNLASSPNGTLTADLLIGTAIDNRVRLQQSVSATASTSYAFSVYAKAENYTVLGLREGSTTGAWTQFDLTLGTVRGSGNGGSGTIMSVGNGWYRCTMISNTAVAQTSFRGDIYLLSTAQAIVDPANILWTPNGTSGIYIWGAQLEIGSTATTYNPTTVKNLLGFSEAFENAAWTKSNSFVQTNLLTFSEAFDNAAWVKVNTTVTSNNILAPNGYETADKLILANTLTSGDVRQAINLTSSVSYTVSVYVKAAEHTALRIQINNSTAFAFADVNTITGSISAASGTLTGLSSFIEPVINNWYRCTITFTATSTASSTVRFAPILVIGDGTSGIYLWGAQVVQGSVAGDYRRTDAAALPVFYPNHNGVVCAEKLVEDSANARHRLILATSLTNTASTYTTSIYFKAAERQFAFLTSTDTINVYTVVVDLINATITSTSTAGSPVIVATSVQSVGNDWVRVSITQAQTASFQSIQFGVSSSATPAYTNAIPSYQGDGTSGIYIFGAQLSDSASLDPYVLNAGAAPASAAYYGARFDYDPVTLEAKGLLIEEQRSNLLLRSEDFTTSWTLNSATITANTVISPNGTQNADKIVEAATISYHGAFQSVTTSGVLTFSAYFKAAERNYAMLFFDSVGAGRAIFDLVNGTVDSILTGTRVSSANISPVGNGWYRCSITSVSLASSSYFPAVCASNGTASYLGDITKGVYVWGAQLEVGAFPTSYIPTAASAVTRTADVAEIRGSNFYSWYNQNEGTLYADSNTFSSSIATIVASANDNTSNNRIQIGRTNTSNRALRVFVTSNGIEEVSNLGAGTTSVSQFGKVIFGYKVNDFRGAALGTLSAADTLGITPIVNRLEIGFVFSQGSSFNGHIKQINYYNLRLSDSTLQGLTA